MGRSLTISRSTALDGSLLVRCLLEGEFGAETVIGLVGFRESEALAGLASRIDIQQFGGCIAHFSSAFCFAWVQRSEPSLCRGAVASSVPL